MDTLRPADFPQEVLQSPTKPVSFSFRLFLTLVAVSVTITTFPVLQLLLPAQVALLDPQHKVVSLGLVTTVGGLAALVGPPLSGALSDRTTSRFGRRRPWIFAGTLLAAVMLLLLGYASTLPVVALAWTLAQLAHGMQLGGMEAITPEQVPEQQRGGTYAMLVLCNPLSQITGALLIVAILTATHNAFAPAYAALSLLAVALVSFFLLTFHEQPLPAGVMPPLRLRSFLASFWINPRAHPHFTRAWLTYFLVILGLSVGGTYLNYYLRDVIHYESLFPGRTVEQGVATLAVISAVCIALSSLLFGWLSDRLQRRKVFVAGAALLIALGLLLPAVVHTWLAVVLYSVLSNLGLGAFLATALSLITQVLPRAQDRGKDMGIVNMGSGIPQFLAPLLGAIVISSFAGSVGTGYSLLFVIAAALVVVGAVLLLPIKGVR
jgi:MFS family permease